MAEGGSDTISANAYKTEGNKLHAAGKYEEAVEQYTMGISMDPTNHVLHGNRSASFTKLEKYVEALNDANEALKLKPDWAKGYSRKGSALQYLGRFEEARSTFLKGLELEPDNGAMKKGVKECEAEMEGPAASQPLGNPFANLDAILPRLKEDQKTSRLFAEPSYMQMLKSLGEDPMNMQKFLKDDRLRLTLSALLGFELEHPDNMNFNEPPFLDDDVVTDEPEPNETKTTDDTKKFAELSIDDVKHQAQEQKKIGTDYLKKGDLGNAHECYDIAISLDPTDITFYSNKALVYQRQKLPDKVREMCEQAIEVWKEHGGDSKVIAKAYMRIGQTYMDENKFEIALDNFQLSLKHNSIKETEDLAEKCRENLRKQGS